MKTTNKRSTLRTDRVRTRPRRPRGRSSSTGLDCPQAEPRIFETRKISTSIPKPLKSQKFVVKLIYFKAKSTAIKKCSVNLTKEVSYL